MSTAQLKVIGAICSAVFLSACSSSNDSGDVIDLPGLAVIGLNGEPAEQVTNPWLATIRTFRLDSETPGTGDAEISTIQYNNALRTVQDAIDFYGGTVELDTCEVVSNESSGGMGGGSSNVPYVSAGAEVVINAPNGTWFTITQGDTGQYEVDDELPGAFPAGATLSIPGDVFPSVAAFPITEPVTPVRISPPVDDVSILDTYQWQPISAPGTYIRLALLEYDSNGEFLGFLFGCDVEDDGEFELPENALNTIQATSPDSVLRARYARTYRSLEVFEGVVVYSRIRVAE